MAWQPARSQRWTDRFVMMLLVAALLLALPGGTALAATPPVVSVMTQTINLSGTTKFQVPVYLDTGGHTLSLAMFAVDYDNGCLTFDAATDSNNDGVPDAVSGLPANASTSFWHADYNGDGQPEVALLIGPNGSTGALPAFVDDAAVATLEFTVKEACVDNTGGSIDAVFSFPVTSKPKMPRFANEGGKKVNAGVPVAGTYTIEFNKIPGDIDVIWSDSDGVPENQAPDTLIGVLTVNDAGAHVFTLSEAAGCAHDGNFAVKIVGNQLLTKGPYDYEGQASYNICVHAADEGGLSVDEPSVVHVQDMPEAPTEIRSVDPNNPSVADTSIDEGLGAHAVVSRLTTIDEDGGETFTYSLAACAGADNGVFEIAGDLLQAKAELDFEQRAAYNICVRSTDSDALFVDWRFTIRVNDLNDSPVALSDNSAAAPLVVFAGEKTVIDVLDNDTDPDGTGLTVGGVWQPSQNFVTIQAPPDFVDILPSIGYKGPYDFYYWATDGIANSGQATVWTYVVGKDAAGDCNFDGEVDAADFAATSLEIFDNDTGIGWWLTYTGGHEGSPAGCDSNGLRNGMKGDQPSVDSADLVCTVRLFFGETCEGVYGAAELDGASASLSIGSGLSATAGQPVAVPIVLDTAGRPVAAVAFSLGYDPAVFSLNAADGDADGVPDAVRLFLPVGVAKAVRVDAQTGKVNVVAFGAGLPLPLLQDGVLASIELHVKGDAASGISTLGLTTASLGSDRGQGVPVAAAGSAVVIGSGGLYLPAIQWN